jgi:hypothetical protein
MNGRITNFDAPNLSFRTSSQQSIGGRQPVVRYLILTRIHINRRNPASMG